jgi:hypothetical protein
MIREKRESDFTVMREKIDPSFCNRKQYFVTSKYLKPLLSVGDKVEIIVDCEVKGDIGIVHKIHRKYKRQIWDDIFHGEFTITIRMISGKKNGHFYKLYLEPEHYFKANYQLKSDGIKIDSNRIFQMKMKSDPKYPIKNFHPKKYLTENGLNIIEEKL